MVVGIVARAVEVDTLDVEFDTLDVEFDTLGVEFDTLDADVDNFTGCCCGIWSGL